MKALQTLLGEAGPKSLEETPTVALAISGGGYRAVSTSCGAMEALMEKGLFDTLTYCVGLSGSVWYLSSTYVTESLSSLEKLKEHHNWLREQLGKPINFNTWTTVKYAFKSMFKTRKLSLTDVFGVALRDVLLPEKHKKAKISTLKGYVQNGQVPLPIFSAAHVKNHYPVVEFWEELELTPFEATYASYRLLVPIERINCSWKNGIMAEPRDEPMLHYIMGFCGCAFAILLYHITDENETKERSFWNSWKDMLDGAWSFVSRPAPAPRGMPYSEDIMSPTSMMSKEEFKMNVWDPILAKDVEEEDEDMTLDGAYDLYIYYWKSGVAEYIVNALEMLRYPASPMESTRRAMDGPLPAPPADISVSYEGLGRNIGFFRRTGFLPNPLYEMPHSIEKYMLDNQPIEKRNLDSTTRIVNKASTTSAECLVVDSGLGCNVPAIHVARPQRKVDVIIVVDCEAKSEDKEWEESYGTLKALQQQMTDNNMKFPTIDLDKIKEEDPVQEYYLFEDVDDPDCPIVIWFTLYNTKFRTLLNAPRSNEYPPAENGDVKFNNFDVTPESPVYATTNLEYSPRDVDRLRELMRYNIGVNVEIIKNKLARKVVHLRSKANKLS